MVICQVTDHVQWQLSSERSAPLCTLKFLDTFIIQSIENKFCQTDVICFNDILSCERGKGLEAFYMKNNIVINLGVNITINV